MQALDGLGVGKLLLAAAPAISDRFHPGHKVRGQSGIRASPELLAAQ